MRAKAYIIQSASMGADNPPLVLGQIEFAQIGALVFINGTITRLTDGEHGFHIHTNSDCVNGSSIHFNPNRMTHGAQSDTTRHIGDLGNILAMNGSANINMTDTLIKLSGPFSIIGRSIVIHAMADDLGRGGVASSLTSGNSGVPVACGVIGIVN